jgi:hypothetical protein
MFYHSQNVRRCISQPDVFFFLLFSFHDMDGSRFLFLTFHIILMGSTVCFMVLDGRMLGWRFRFFFF